MTRELFVLIVTVCLWLSLLLVRRIEDKGDRYDIMGLTIFSASLLTIWLFITVGIALPTAFPGVK